MLSSRHRPFVKVPLREKNPQPSVVIYNLLSLQPVLPCNLSSVSAFFSAKNSYNGYIKSSKFWFPFSLFCGFHSNPSTRASSAIATQAASNPLSLFLLFAAHRSVQVYRHPSLYFICKALGGEIVSEWFVLGISYSPAVDGAAASLCVGEELIQGTAENTTCKHLE